MMDHGGNIEEIKRKFNINDLVDFSANINPLGINNLVKKEMIVELNNIENYPDITYFKLKNEISIYEKVQKENIVLGNGAAEVIFNISRALKPKKALNIEPTFSEYEDALKSVDCKVIHYEMDKDFILKESFIDNIKKDIDIIFICNPNNPTGKLVEKSLIRKILTKALECETTIVIDESFLDFVENKNDYSFINEIDQYKNLIIVKSLTKFFAYPGIRLGYGITANPKYLKKLQKVSIAWNINRIAARAGEVSLRREAYINASIENLKEEKKNLLDGLEKFKDLKIFSGTVNFIFFKAREDLKEKLLEKGVLIRCCENYIGLTKGYFRIAVRKREENLKLIKALEEIYLNEK
ncbi:MAG: threonine-phosphate decarboxylase CobD [Clostridium sp.]|uniref:threonine-phosphate decarboxylase CobD n=1 Tax=Clostridium sp. TaxID=1506 RepID=UPI003F2ED57F